MADSVPIGWWINQIACQEMLRVVFAEGGISPDAQLRFSKALPGSQACTGDFIAFGELLLRTFSRFGGIRRRNLQQAQSGRCVPCEPLRHRIAEDLWISLHRDGTEEQ